MSNEAVGLAGRMQQDGRIESFDITLLTPNGSTNGHMALYGSADQVSALREDEEFLRNTADAAMIVENLRHTTGVCNEGVARMMEIYSEAVAKVPQTV